MMRRLSKLAGALLALATAPACGDGGTTSAADTLLGDGLSDAAGADTATDTAADVVQVALGGAECSVVSEQRVGGSPVTLRRVTPSCVDPRTVGRAGVEHYVLSPATVERGVWVHLPGSGGEPSNTTNILRAAVSQGYAVIGLAYVNEPSVGSSCEGQPIACKPAVRQERLWGVERSEHTDVGPQDGVVFRLRRLFEYLDAQEPSVGWGDYLTADEVDWSRISLSGFSQGGGMVGMLSRDRAVQRAMFLSIAADPVRNVDVDPEGVPRCDADTPCAEGVCCTLEGACDPVPESDGYCIVASPAPWALAGADSDGDHAGDGDASTRATPPGRLFGLVHRDEPAWTYTPDVLAAWGADAFGAFVDADTEEPPYGGAHLLSTGLAPVGSCSEHQSTGNDFCQPKLPSGLPAMARAWIYMMTAPTE